MPYLPAGNRAAMCTEIYCTPDSLITNFADGTTVETLEHLERQLDSARKVVASMKSIATIPVVRKAARDAG